MSNKKYESPKPQTSTAVLDKELYKSILKIFGCEKSVGVSWRSWNGEKIPVHLFEAVTGTHKIVYTEKRASALCSMLARALNQDFGQEKFNIKESGSQEDYSCSYEESVNYASALFFLIHEIADIENNSHAKYIYDCLRQYCVGMAMNIEKDSSSELLRDVDIDTLVGFIAPFLYVFYVELVCESFKNLRLVDKSDIAELFVNIFCSKVFLDHFKEKNDFEFDFSKVNECKKEYVFLVKHDIYTFKKEIYKEESEIDYEKRMNDALRGLIDKIYTVPDEMSDAKYMKMTDSYNYTSSRLLKNNKKTRSFIAEGGNRINFLEFKKTIDESELDEFDYSWFIRWFVRKRLFSIELPEIANDAMKDAELYVHFRNCAKKKQSECSEEHYNTSEDYLDFADSYCDLYCSETEISHDSFLSFLLSNGLLIVNREQMSTNDKNNDEQKNKLKHDLFKDYWAKDDNDDDDDDDDYKESATE